MDTSLYCGTVFSLVWISIHFCRCKVLFICESSDSELKQIASQTICEIKSNSTESFILRFKNNDSNKYLFGFLGPLLQKMAPLDPGLGMPQCDYEPEQYQVVHIKLILNHA